MHSLLHFFYPQKEYPSIWQIPFEDYHEKGFRGIIFDIDNTLVRHNAPADEKIRDFFNKIHGLGLRTVLLSNNDENRVKPFAEAVESAFLPDGGKPLKKGYLEACNIMNLSPEKVIFIGDQIYTDIWGANNAGVYSILVAPIHNDTELQIRFKRWLEKPVLYFYRKNASKNEP